MAPSHAAGPWRVPSSRWFPIVLLLLAGCVDAAQHAGSRRRLLIRSVFSSRRGQSSQLLLTCTRGGADGGSFCAGRCQVEVEHARTHIRDRKLQLGNCCPASHAFTEGLVPLAALHTMSNSNLAQQGWGGGGVTKCSRANFVLPT